MFRKHVIVLWMIIYVTNLRSLTCYRREKLENPATASLSSYLPKRITWLLQQAWTLKPVSARCCHSTPLSSVPTTDFIDSCDLKTSNNLQISENNFQFLMQRYHIAFVTGLQFLYTNIFFEYSISSTVDSTIMAWHHWLGYLTLYFYSKLHWNATRHI